MKNLTMNQLENLNVDNFSETNDTKTSEQFVKYPLSQLDNDIEVIEFVDVLMNIPQPNLMPSTPRIH